MIKALLLACLAAAASAGEPKILLPSGVKADWAYGPGPALAPSVRFIAKPDKIWLLLRPDALVSNTRKGMALLFTAQDLVSDAQGRLWMSDARSAGTLDLAPNYRSAALKKTLLLPSPAWRLADGGEFGPLAYGTDPEDGLGKAVRLDDQRVVFSLPSRVLALQGTPSGLAVATPDGVFLLDKAGQLKPTGFAQAVRSLAYVAGSGLCAATEDGAWLLPSQGKPQAFLSAPGLRLRAHGSTLYALLPEQGGVLRLRGLEALQP